MSIETPVYLITGAAGGLGSALAAQLLGQSLRKQYEPELILLDKSLRKLEQTADNLEAEFGVQPVLMPLDMAGASSEDYAEMVQALGEQFGHLDGLMFTQVQFGGLRSLQQTHDRDWLLDMQANLGGSHILLQACVGLLNAATAGKVMFTVNTVDNVDSAYWGAYGVAQHAIPVLAKQWAEELGNTNIRVGVCQPPAMRTGLRAEVWPATLPETWSLPDDTALKIADWLYQSKLPARLHTVN